MSHLGEAGPAAEREKPPTFPSPGSPGVWMIATGLTFASAGTGFSLGPMLGAVTADTGWGKTEIALGATLCMVTAMLASPQIGRMVDRGRGIEAITVATIWGGLMLMLVSLVQSLWQWYLVWALVGPAFAGALYEPSFAFIARRLGPNARGAMIRVTLVAGFTSSLAFLLGGALIPLVGWRGAYVMFGLLALFGGAPMYWYGGKILRRGEIVVPRGTNKDPGVILAALKQWVFWRLAGVICLISLNNFMLQTVALPLFASFGATAAMATIFAASLGPFQVLGRFGLMFGAEHIQARAWSAAMLIIMIGGTISLASAGFSIWLIVVFAFLQGTSVGIFSILRPLLTAEVMGTRGFGAVTGTLAIAALLASATAPVLAASMFENFGAPGFLLTCFVALSVALGLTLSLPRSRPTAG